MPARGQGTAPIEILLLDDSDVDLRRLTRALRKIGRPVRIFGCRTLQEFERALNADTYDLCLIDHGLEEKASGLDAIEALRAHKAHPKTPAVLMFDFADPDLLLQGSQAGFAQYIDKSSLSPEQLAQVVAKALEAPRGVEASPTGHEMHLRLKGEMANAQVYSTKQQINMIYEQVGAMRTLMAAGQVPETAALDAIESACFKLWRFTDLFQSFETESP